MTRVAHLMRAEDLESSPASIIEATRLAETTAVLRGCRLPGLAEFNDAAQAVEWSRKVVKEGGAITWDTPVDPTGKIAPEFLEQLTAIGKAVRQ